MSVQSVYAEQMGFFCTRIYLTSLENESGIYPTKKNECVLQRQIDHKFVVFITYYKFDVDLMDVL